MKTLSVKYSIQLPTKSAKPSRWVPGTIADRLTTGERDTDWDFKQRSEHITDVSFKLSLLDDTTTDWLPTVISDQLSPEDGEQLLDYQLIELA